MLLQHGFELVERVVGAGDLTEAGEILFHDGEAGTRCLLDLACVKKVAHVVRTSLVQSGHLSADSVAIQAIAFDKTVAANWKVTWHQDLMFPFAGPVGDPGYLLPSIKDGVHYARPPTEILHALLAARVHLDECDETNGPLRVSPDTHRDGVIPSAAIADTVRQHGEHLCLARAGDVLLMKPLLLHASSVARVPRRRRVLHLVYHSGPAGPEPWHRSV